MIFKTTLAVALFAALVAAPVARADICTQYADQDMHTLCETGRRLMQCEQVAPTTTCEDNLYQMRENSHRPDMRKQFARRQTGPITNAETTIGDPQQ